MLPAPGVAVGEATSPGKKAGNPGEIAECSMTWILSCLSHVAFDII